MTTTRKFMTRPQTSLKLRDACRVKYLISSHVAYNKPLETVLSSMSSIPAVDKTVVVAGSATPGTRVVGEVPHHDVRENAYELTGLIHVSQNPHLYEGYDYVLLLHDTIELGARTTQLVGDHPAFDFDISQTCDPPRTNMALYKVQFLVDQAEVLSQYDGISKLEAMNMEILAHPLSLDKFTDKMTHFNNASFKRVKQTRKYSTDERWEAYIASIDVTKWYKKCPDTELQSEFRHRP